MEQAPPDMKKESLTDPQATKRPSNQKKDLSAIDPKEDHLICVDPDSHQIYTLNPKTNEYWIETSVSKEYRQKAEKTIRKIQAVVNLTNGTWLIDSEKADKYRRRQIPEYLLSSQTTKYPQYLCLSPLSDAFKDNLYIRVIVDVANYIDLLDARYASSISNFMQLQKRYQKDLNNQDKDQDNEKGRSKSKGKKHNKLNPEDKKRGRQIYQQKIIQIVDYLSGLSKEELQKQQLKENKPADPKAQNQAGEIRKVGLRLYIGILTA